MPRAARILQANSDVLPATRPSDPFGGDSDVVVIVSALLCALICVVGLALVARCAWLRRGASAAPPCKGLKKKALWDLPKVSYVASSDAKLAECPICLAEFVAGDEIRILPQCGHGFHVGCVDTWLMSRSSCPFCRRALIVAPLAAQPSPRYGASSEDSCAATSAASAMEEAAKAREEGGACTFLP